MRKLLSADLHHLLKTKILWITTAFMLCLTIFLVLLGGRVDAMEHLGRDLDYYYFRFTPYLGLFLSVFIALFTGTEFSDGTIRNKLIVGHKRTDIYLANLLSCFVGCIIIFLAWALGGLAGIPYFGLWSVGITGYFELLLIELLSVFAITAVLVLEAQLITNKATSVAVTIFSAFGMLLLGSYFYNALCEPETTVSYVKISADGMVDYGPEIANPAYIGGTLRTVYQVLLHLLPPGQQIWIADETVTHPLFMCICSFIVITISTVIGLFLFRKKDLK